MSPVFLGFTLISGKRIHYLLPLLPGLALVLAWAFDKVNTEDWLKPRLFYGVVLGFLGLVFVLLPELSIYIHWWPELAGISPVWGVVVCLSAILLVGLPAKAVQESVCLISIASITTALSLASCFFSVNGQYYDTAPPAKKIAELLNKIIMWCYLAISIMGNFNLQGV